MTSFRTIEIGSYSEWDRYVNDHPKGTIFHTSSMFRVFDASPNYEPMHIAARNERGEIVAILCAVRISTVGGVMSRFASRSVMYSDPICDDTDEGVAALAELIELHDRRWSRITVFSEVRCLFDEHGSEQVALEKCGHKLLPYCNYVNDLDEGPQSLALKSKKSQRKIRTAKRRGLQIRRVQTAAEMDEVYRLIRASYSRSLVPPTPRELFRAAREYFFSRRAGSSTWKPQWKQRGCDRWAGV